MAARMPACKLRRFLSQAPRLKLLVTAGHGVNRRQYYSRRMAGRIAGLIYMYIWVEIGKRIFQHHVQIDDTKAGHWNVCPAWACVGVSSLSSVVRPNTSYVSAGPFRRRLLGTRLGLPWYNWFQNYRIYNHSILLLDLATSGSCSRGARLRGRS